MSGALLPLSNKNESGREEHPSSIDLLDFTAASGSASLRLQSSSCDRLDVAILPSSQA